jgi:sulfur-carrier protein
MRAMAVLRLRQPLKRLAGDRAEHTIAAGTVGEMLRELERAHPTVRGWVLDERGALRRHMNVYVNGEPGAEDSPVGAEDKVDLLPAISGG